MGVSKRGLKFGTLVGVLQTVFIVAIAIWGKYNPVGTKTSSYPNFQDVNAMIFLGFGFLMTFLKNYGFSAVGLNLAISVISIQWAFIVGGFINSDIIGGDSFGLGVEQMVGANFATATVLISFGAVLGKASPVQLVIMAIIEIVIAQLNKYVGHHLLHTKDIGESMFIHMFGAYFGLAVAFMLYDPDVKESTKEGSVYHSDIFAMIGTLILWIYWPSFNGGFAEPFSDRAYINTFLSLCACTAVTFAVSAFLDKEGRFDMVHVQNSTLAGGVAVGACANMPMEPWGAMLFGSVAGLISVVGYKFITPFMAKHLRIHDTCGVHNLHGMPAWIAAIGAAVLAAMSDDWDRVDRVNIFPETFTSSEHVDGKGRTFIEQGGFQMAAAAITVAFAIVGGVLTGLVMKLPLWDAPREDSLFDDVDNWEMPEEGVPGLHEVTINNHYKVNEAAPTDANTRM